MRDSHEEPTELSETEDARRIGPYRVDGVIGRGGMGEVLEGYDEALQRPVAIKRVTGRADADARARFWREARALAALGHPGIVTIFQVGETDDGELYIAMERVDGRPLSGWLGAPWPAPHAVEVAQQIAVAVGAAHATGIVHRDIKPGNLLLQPDGQVRVVDFGLARRAADGVTATGARVGTPAYMAPEQIEGAPATPASDVFSIGVVLYRMLTGEHPFSRDSKAATAMAIAAGAHRPLVELRPDLPQPLVALAERCLATAPTRRPVDGAALASELAACGLAPAGPEAVASFSAEPDSGASFPAASFAPAPAGPRSAGAWLAGGLLLVAVAAAVWWVNGTPGTPPAMPGASVASTSPSSMPGLDVEAAAPLPARPVVAVLGFEASDERTAEIAADALRRDLNLDPGSLVSVQWAALTFGDPGRLTRPGRRPGHIDVTIRGVLREGRALAVLTDTEGSMRAEVEVAASPRRPIEAARALAPRIMSVLGGSFPADPPPLPAADAYGAYLDYLQAAKDGAYEAARAAADWATRLDPGFSGAALGHLALLRAERRMDALKEAASALLGRGGQAPRDRAMAEAFLAMGDGRPTDALRMLHRVAERWPYDTEALHAMLVLRFHDAGTQDMAEAERLARRILAISPRDDGAASRLVRSLSFRGRVAEAEAAMRATGVPEDDADFVEV